jgi:hypothetical protein
MTSYRPEYWRERAQRTRAKAEICRDRNMRDKLLRVVGEYERLARRAEQWHTVEKVEIGVELPAGEQPSRRAGPGQISRPPGLVLVYVNPSVPPAVRRGSAV